MVKIEWYTPTKEQAKKEARSSVLWLLFDFLAFFILSIIEAGLGNSTLAYICFGFSIFYGVVSVKAKSQLKESFRIRW